MGGSYGKSLSHILHIIAYCTYHAYICILTILFAYCTYSAYHTYFIHPAYCSLLSRQVTNYLTTRVTLHHPSLHTTQMMILLISNLQHACCHLPLQHRPISTSNISCAGREGKQRPCFKLYDKQMHFCRENPLLCTANAQEEVSGRYIL